MLSDVAGLISLKTVQKKKEQQTKCLTDFCQKTKELARKKMWRKTSSNPAHF